MDEAPVFTWDDLPSVDKIMRRNAHNGKAKWPACSEATADIVQGVKLVLLETHPGDWPSREYYLGAFNRALRRYLSNRGRKVKRRVPVVPLESGVEQAPAPQAESARIEDLDIAMGRLAKRHPEWVRALVARNLDDEDTAITAQREKVGVEAIEKWRQLGYAALRTLLRRIEAERSRATTNSRGR